MSEPYSLTWKYFQRARKCHFLQVQIQSIYHKFYKILGFIYFLCLVFCSCFYLNFYNQTEKITWSLQKLGFTFDGFHSDLRPLTLLKVLFSKQFTYNHCYWEGPVLGLPFSIRKSQFSHIKWVVVRFKPVSTHQCEVTWFEDSNSNHSTKETQYQFLKSGCYKFVCRFIYWIF